MTTGDSSYAITQESEKTRTVSVGENLLFRSQQRPNSRSPSLNNLSSAEHHATENIQKYIKSDLTLFTLKIENSKHKTTTYARGRNNNGLVFC